MADHLTHSWLSSAFRPTPGRFFALPLAVLSLHLAASPAWADTGAQAEPSGIGQATLADRDLNASGLTLAQADPGTKGSKQKQKKRKKKPKKSASAAEGDASNVNAEAVDDENAEGAVPGETAGGDTSRDARQGDTINFGVMFGFIPRAAYGAQLGFVASPSVTLETFLETGSFGFLNYSSDRYRTGLRALWFPGNSFFLSGGLAYDYYTSKLTQWLGDGTWEGSFSQLEIEGSIGNRWTWNPGFYIGVHWVGYSGGVAQISRESTATGSEAEKLKAAIEDSLEKLANFLPIHFLKLHLGWSF